MSKPITPGGGRELERVNAPYVLMGGLVNNNDGCRIAGDWTSDSEKQQTCKGTFNGKTIDIVLGWLKLHELGHCRMAIDGGNHRGGQCRSALMTQ